MVEINFLCVHKKHRKNRLAPVLIKEITRRVHLEDLWQACYTAGVLIPKPFSRSRYYHRNLNFKKLVEINFTYMNPNLNMAQSKKIYKLPKDTNIPGLRKMEEKDVEAVHSLLSSYLKKFTVYVDYSKDEVRHWFLTREDVVYSYVVEDKESGLITDFFSFYSLPSTVLNNDKHKILRVAYSFFNVVTKNTLKNLLKNALIVANSLGFDVFNALDLMDNESVLLELLFSAGDGTLKYYLYNYKCPEIKPSKLAVVMM